MYCPKCGSRIDNDALFCSKCGASLEDSSVMQTAHDSPSDYQTSQSRTASKKLQKGIITVGVLAVLYIIGSLGSEDSLNPNKNDISMNSTSLADLITVDEANAQLEAWSEDHLLYWPAYELVDEHNTSRTAAGSYLYTIWIADWELQLYIDKDTGEMFVDCGKETMPLEEWYELYYDEGIYEADYEEYYPMLDENLIGRWRSYDGGMLEFDEYGNILSCDFTCWTVTDYTRWDGTPNYITWEASNGRVNCTACFQYTKTYEISASSEDDGVERLRFNGMSDWYYRDTGTPGGGIIGKWLNEDWGVFSCQFDEGGTGFWNNMYPISWYTYEIDNEGSDANVLEYTIYDATYFDYQVSGNMLTVFLSNSSKTYTKVST